jgi:prepilin-type N-terminal cleavage/methylation domain-containing protein
MEIPFKKQKFYPSKTPARIFTFRKKSLIFQNSGSRGFSLVEVIIVIALIGIISLIAAPQMSTMLSNYRIKNAANELAGAIQLARATAISRNANCVVEVIMSSPQGIVVFVDDGANGSGTAKNWEKETNEEIIYRINMTDYPTVTIENAVFTNTGGATKCGFNSRGLSVRTGSSYGYGFVTLRNSKGKISKVNVSEGAGINITTSDG